MMIATKQNILTTLFSLSFVHSVNRHKYLTWAVNNCQHQIALLEMVMMQSPRCYQFEEKVKKATGLFMESGSGRADIIIN